MVLSPTKEEAHLRAVDSSVNRIVNNAANGVVSNGSTPAGNIFIQAGSFSQEQNALAFSRQLSAYGPANVSLTSVEGQPFYRVRLGPFADTQTASNMALALNKSGHANAVLVVE